MIRKVYEVDPLTCPECGAQAPVTSAMEPRIFMLRPSSKGRDLSEVLTALARWGKKHVRGTVVPAEFRKNLNARANALAEGGNG